MLSGIRELRLKRGLTQKDVSRMTGINQAKISYIERGFPLTSEEKEKLVKAFGMAEED